MEEGRESRMTSIFLGLGNWVGGGTTYCDEGDWRRSKFRKGNNEEFDLGQLRLRHLSGNVR